MILWISMIWKLHFRAVARSKNLGGHVELDGDNVPPLVEIGLTDLSKSWGARAPRPAPLATGMIIVWHSAPFKHTTSNRTKKQHHCSSFFDIFSVAQAHSPFQCLWKYFCFTFDKYWDKKSENVPLCNASAGPAATCTTLSICVHEPRSLRYQFKIFCASLVWNHVCSYRKLYFFH